MICFLRHGECVENLKMRFAGRSTDSPLTEKGMLQAQEAAGEFKYKGIKIDRIISSPLIRAKLTAEIFADTIGFDKTKIEIDERIAEYDLGVLSGKDKAGVTALQKVQAEGAEDPIDFLERVGAAYDEYSSYKGNILLVSHAGVGRMLHARKVGMQPENFYEVASYPNAHVEIGI
jgi:broad specificity phosphatase PhoE